MYRMGRTKKEGSTAGRPTVLPFLLIKFLIRFSGCGFYVFQKRESQSPGRGYFTVMGASAVMPKIMRMLISEISSSLPRMVPSLICLL